MYRSVQHYYLMVTLIPNIKKATPNNDLEFYVNRIYFVRRIFREITIFDLRPSTEVTESKRKTTRNNLCDHFTNMQKRSIVARCCLFS